MSYPQSSGFHDLNTASSRQADNNFSSGGITVQKPNLPQGGGSIQGLGENFQMNELTGTASLSLPIKATPCRNFSPQLSLDYNSGSGNSPWGLGWSLSVPVITRKTSKQLPRYDTADTFLLNGDDLVPLAKQENTPQILNGIIYNILVYQTRQEGSFTLIEYWQPQDITKQSAAFWKTVSADHVVGIFGYTPQARISDPANAANIFLWLLEESYDTRGNHQLLFYQQENTDNVPDACYEQNRMVTANRYLHCVRYGYAEPVADAMVLNLDPAVEDPGQWHFELIFDYGEYDAGSANAYQPVRQWACRSDPFSAYQAGFEIRTYRRCLQILLFHRFNELGAQPVLVNTMAFNYEANALTGLSQLISVQETGYQYQGLGQPYLTQPMPLLALNYTDFQLLGASFTLLQQQSGDKPLPGFEQAPHYQFVDLYGEGIPGILYTDGQSTYYQSPVLTTGPSAHLQSATAREDTIFYSMPKQCLVFPLERRVAGDNMALMDVTGNGQLDLVISGAGAKGYYEINADDGWQNFQPFQSFPSDYHQANQQLADLTGQGLADLVMLTEDSVRVYPAAGSEGFGRSWSMPAPDHFPLTLETTAQILTIFTSMTGTGTPCLVQIKKNEVIYWPSLGYAKFARPIVMGNAPDFGDDFSTKRLLLTDIDGSGTTDLIYLDHNTAIIYMNQSGNQFSEPIPLTLPVSYDELDQVSCADVFGKGTNCLILSVPHAQPTPVHWCYDFCQQLKPYLLNRIDNNKGATTVMTYASSVEYYLADKAAGLPWITNLPFPVQVIAQITHTDPIANTTEVSQYRYHHGYYDGVEREFRGFGRVDRQDTETIRDFSNTHNSYQAPPSLSKTWYHIGAYLQTTDLLTCYQREFWQGDLQAYALPATVFNFTSTPSTEDQRLAYLALYGTVLREEVYGLDGSEWQAIPYQVQETRMQVNELQAKGNNLYAVFFTYALESINYNYERNPQDPHCSHHFTLAIDSYGHVLQACNVAYGRRVVPESDAQLYQPAAQTIAQQQAIRFVYEQNSYLNQSDPDNYLLGVEQEAQAYEISNLIPADGSYFSWEELAMLFANGVNNMAAATSKLLGWARNYYFDPVQQAELSLGKVTLQALHCRKEHVAFLKADVPQVLLPELDEAANGYWHDADHACYWNPGSFQAYLAQAGFYLPSYFCDALHYQDWQQAESERIATFYRYDPNYLIVYQITDPLGNQLTFPLEKIDYRVVLPTQMIDANGNITEVVLDPLGRVIVSSHYGTEGGTRIGFAPVADYQLQTGVSVAEIVANPSAYLQQAEAFFYYDDLAWQSQQTPVCALKVSAQDFAFPRHPVTTPAALQISLNYSDGLGRLLQAKALVDQPNTVVRVWDTATSQVIEQVQNSAWLTSGACQYNNKGAVVKQYEPFFAATYDYVGQTDLNQVGVSDTLYYDALGRKVLIITANGYLEKILAGYLTSGTTREQGGHLAHYLYQDLPGNFQPSSWNTLAFDGNDAIKQSPYYLQAPADEQATINVLFYNTPMLSYADSLGRVVQAEQLLVAATEKNAVYTELDIAENALTQADGRLFESNDCNFQMIYNLVNQTVETTAADSGISWTLMNVLGNNCYQQNGRGFIQRIHYDSLQRPLLTTVTGGDGATPLCLTTEIVIYGESCIDPQRWNLRGQPVVHFDQSGVVLMPFVSIDGQALANLKALCKDYKNTPNWQLITTETRQRLIQAIEQIAGPCAIGTTDLSSISALDPEIYLTTTDYGARGQIIQMSDPDGNITTPTYYCNGWLAANRMSSGLAIESITYNAKGQRTLIRYGNQVTTTYIYEDKTFRLQNILSVYTPQNKVLQDYTYTYDPVDNVLTFKQNNIPTVFFSNQAVDAVATYDYDSLYRLIQATGREHIGIGNQNNAMLKESLLHQPLSNGQALQRYTESYQYDAGNNLTMIQHSAAATGTSWTRTHAISADSNRLLSSMVGNGISPIADYTYDANGNILNLEGLQQIIWNERDNIQTAVLVARDAAPDDAEYYVYDSAGVRVRKVWEQQTDGGTTIHDVIYLGNFQIRRNITRAAVDGSETVNDDWRLVRFMDGSTCAAVWRYAADANGAADVKKNQYRYQLNNHLDSSMLEVNQCGQIISYEEYYPFGGTAYIAPAGDTDAKVKYYRYSFKELDASTGLYYYGMRYYPPWLGRWLNPDPASTIAGLNLYAFVNGNPTTKLDIAGMAPAGIRENIGRRVRSTLITQEVKIESKEPQSKVEGKQEEKSAEIEQETKVVSRNQWASIIDKITSEDLFNHIEIDERSKKLFEISNENVAFVGVYDIFKNKMYLHPLTPWNEYYNTNPFHLNVIQRVSNFGWGSVLDDFFEPITHDPGNANTTTSHARIFEKYGIMPVVTGLTCKNYIGFSVIKNDPNYQGLHSFNGQSNTLNKTEEMTSYQKFEYINQTEESEKRKDAYLPLEWSNFLMQALVKLMPQEFTRVE